MTTPQKTNSIRRILAPLDGTEPSQVVIPYIQGLAKVSDARVILFRAVENESSVAEADDYLEDIAADLRTAGMGVATDTGTGSPADAIVAAAREHRADLIAMTGHSQLGGRQDLMGSVAQAVLSKCETPVLALRTADTRWVQPEAIVVGLDGSEDARRALNRAVTLASTVHCDLALVRAVEPVAPLSGAAKYYGAVDDFAEDYMDKIKLELADTGLNVSVHVGKRSPEQELLGVADSRPGSIIVVATSGLTGKPGVLGSTTDRLVRTQSHPVLAVPS